MSIRDRIRSHPHITAVVTFVISMLMLGWLMPDLWHQPSEWGKATVTSVVPALLVYFNRIGSYHAKAYVLVSVSLSALIVYAMEVHVHGIPRETSERLYFAGVIAIPVCGIALALWMLRDRSSRA